MLLYKLQNHTHFEYAAAQSVRALSHGLECDGSTSQAIHSAHMPYTVYTVVTALQDISDELGTHVLIYKAILTCHYCFYKTGGCNLSCSHAACVYVSKINNLRQAQHADCILRIPGMSTQLYVLRLPIEASKSSILFVLILINSVRVVRKLRVKAAHGGT